MTIVSSLSVQTSSLSTAASVNQSGASSTADGFGALVDARARANEDRTASAPLLPPPNEAAAPGANEPAPKSPACPSAATIAMVSTLDRSAKMLSRAPAAGAASGAPVDKTDKSAAEATAPTADTTTSIALPLVGALPAVSVLPMIASASQPSAPCADAPTALTGSGSKSPALPTPASTALAATPLASSDVLVAVQRTIIGFKSRLDGDRDAAAPKSAHEFVGVMAPAGSAMLHDLASLAANDVTASTQPDVAVVNRHLDLARGDAWLNDLASDIAATATTGGRLKFGLAPETLGRMDVEIRQGAAGVTVHMTTSTETARDMLTAAQPRIVDEIRAQGVRVAGTQVSTDASGFGGDRAGNTPRQPVGMPIDVALSVPDTAAFRTSEPVANGRFA